MTQTITQALGRVAEVGCGNSPTLLGIPPWYQYVPTTQIDGKCEFAIDLSGNPGQVWLIALGVVDILLRVGAIVAIGFIIYGGFQYMISQGEPDRTTAARHTIINALVGLVISILATTVVAFIGRQVG